MRQIGTKSARYFKKIVTLVVAFAMVVTSLAVSATDAEAAKKKVKKVSIGVKVGGSGILVLKKGQKKKLNVSVTPKKASKKVSYKSSNKKVVSVNQKGVVKARKAKGSAKITVTSKQNKKKKATITVKIGTPIKKVTINKTGLMEWQSANFTLVEKNGQLQKDYPKFKENVTMKNGAFNVVAGRTLTLKATVAPKKPTSKKVKWEPVSGKSYVSVVPTGKLNECKVALRTVKGKPNYKVTLVATAMDGSGKKATVKLNVGEFKSDKTPAPTKAPDTRNLTKVEDFEGYEVGTVWDRYTAAGQDQGHMTVVQDPENPENKCLQVKFDGTGASYDFAPVFGVDLSKLSDSTGKSAEGKTLGNYTGINADVRVVGNDSDVTYKTIHCYFDQYGAIQKSDKFAADANKSASAHVDKDGNVVAAGSETEDKSIRFGVEISHATGSDKGFAGQLYNGKAGAEEKDKYMPAYNENVWKMEEKTTWFIDNSAHTGYKPSEVASDYPDGVVPNVGFASKALVIDQTRIKEMDPTLPDQTKFDVVIGSTYAGTTTYAAVNTSVTLYIDNISLAEEVTPITGFELSVSGEPKVAVGSAVAVNVAYTPENTSQKGLDWTVNNDKVTVDAAGKVSVAEDFVFTTDAPKGQRTETIVVTATSKANPALTKSIELTVYDLPPETELILTADMIDTELSDATAEVTTDAEGRECIKLNFTGNQQRVYFKLPETKDLSAYKSVEIEAYMASQMSFETFADTFDKNADNWWETATTETYPFYQGSHAIRPDSDITLEDFNAQYGIDGSSYAVDGVIPKGTPIGDVATEIEVLDLAEIKEGDWSKTQYVVLGTNQPPDDDFELCNYYIYSMKLIAKTDDEAGSESGSVESASTEETAN